jgi:hypothetical protein
MKLMYRGMATHLPGMKDSRPKFSHSPGTKSAMSSAVMVASTRGCTSVSCPFWCSLANHSPHHSKTSGDTPATIAAMSFS